MCKSILPTMNFLPRDSARIVATPPPIRGRFEHQYPRNKIVFMCVCTRQIPIKILILYSSKKTIFAHFSTWSALRIFTCVILRTLSPAWPRNLPRLCGGTSSRWVTGQHSLYSLAITPRGVYFR